jgi:hypothetical protein
MREDPVISALREQVECYRRLAKLAEVQHVHVAQGEVEALLEVLGRRAGVLEEIARLEGVIGPVKKQWGVYLARLDVRAKGTAEELLAETRALLERITASDRNDALVLQQQKINVGRQIGQHAAAKQVNRRYATAAYGGKSASFDVQQ